MDGDGVEDNLTFGADELDAFYKPNVYGAEIEHIFNTRHGGMPGQRSLEWYNRQSEPEDTYSIV